ncbi:MAG: hypothetical protein WKF95_09125 [Rubrobacter sp.]
MMQEKSVLRWGGLAGVLGGLLFIVVFVIVGVFVGANPAEPEGFPDIRAARTVENSLYLVVLVLWVIHFLALYRALRATSLAPALFGSVLGIVGLGVLAAGALPHVATDRISGLYHAPGANPEDQATLVLLQQATQGIFDALLITGLFILPIGLIALGVAMLGTPAFGKGFGGASAVLGLAGIVAACVGLVDPASPILAVGIFALIIFHLVLGWKVYSLSRNPAGILEDRGYTGNGVRAEGDFNSTEPINVAQQGRETP